VRTLSKQKNIYPSVPLFLSLYLICVVSSRFLGPLYGPIVLTAATVFFVSCLFEMLSWLQRMTFAATLFLGMSPLYLLLRGYVSEEPLTRFDLQIYAIVFTLSFFAFRLFFIPPRSRFINLPHDLKEAYVTFVGFAPLALLLMINGYLREKSLGYSLALFASGDNKNHLVAAVELISYGSLDPATFYRQPISSPSFLSLLISQKEIASESPSENLSQLMQIFSFSWILLIAILSLSFMSISDLLVRQFSRKSLAPAVIALITSAGFVGLFSFSIGPALIDGFYTAIFGVVSLVALLIWFFALYEKNRNSSFHIVLGLVLFINSVFAWMFVLPFSFAILAIGVFNTLSYSKSKQIGFVLWMSIGIIFSILLIHYSNFGQNLIRSAKIAMNTPGAVNATDPKLLYLILFTLAFWALFASNKLFQKKIFQLIAAQLTSLLSLKIFSNLDFLGWNYYLIKYQWMMLVTLSATLLAIVVSQLAMILQNAKKTVAVFAILCLLSSTYLISELSVNPGNIWPKILNGWDNPRAITIDKVLSTRIEVSNPTLFFHFGYAGESRLANFWLNALTVPQEPIKGWNYTIDPSGDVTPICDLNAYYPKVIIITSDPELESLVKAKCPSTEIRIELNKPIFPE